MVKGKIEERGGWHIFRKEVRVCVFDDFLESKDQAFQHVTLCYAIGLTSTRTRSCLVVIFPFRSVVCYLAVKSPGKLLWYWNGNPRCRFRRCTFKADVPIRRRPIR